MPQCAEFKEKRKFIIKLGKALHKFGTNSFRLEAHLQSVADILNIKASFMATTNTLTFILHEGEIEHNYIVRVKPNDIDLGSLARTDELVDELASGQRTLADAIERLDDIVSRPNPYGHLLSLTAFGVSSSAFAMLMQTSWSDVLWSGLISLLVYGYIYWSQYSKRITETLEPLSALTCALVASAISLFDPQINIPLVVLSAIIVFIPGLSLTLGFSELAARHMISGSARIMDAIMTLFKLFFGALLGITFGAKLWGSVEYQASAPPEQWTSWLAVALLSSCLVILFKLRPKEAIWGLVSGFVAHGTTVWAAQYFDIAFAAFFGAFALGVYSNIFSRLMNLPSTTVMLLGLVVLVPGSKVYIGLNTLITDQYIINVHDIGSQAFLILMSLVAGLLFANVAMPSRKTL